MDLNPTKMLVSGNVAVGDTLRSIAAGQMRYVKDQLRLGKISSFRCARTYIGGITVDCISFYGQDVVKISVTGTSSSRILNPDVFVSYTITTRVVKGVPGIPDSITKITFTSKVSEYASEAAVSNYMRYITQGVEEYNSSQVGAKRTVVFNLVYSFEREYKVMLRYGPDAPEGVSVFYYNFTAYYWGPSIYVTVYGYSHTINETRISIGVPGTPDKTYKDVAIKWSTVNTNLCLINNYTASLYGDRLFTSFTGSVIKLSFTCYNTIANIRRDRLFNIIVREN